MKRRATNTPMRSAGPRAVSHPHEPSEREASRAGEVVARGGSVAGWSFTSVSPSAPLQRQETGKPKSEEDKYKEAATKAAEAAAETPQGKALKEKVLADPLVKTVKDAATSTPGLIVGGVGIAGGVAALGAAKKPLPFQPPAIPLDKITPGLSAQVKLEGPVNSPTFVGLTLTYKEQGPKGKKTSESEKIAADIARLRAEQQMFKTESQKKEEQDLVDAWVRSQSGLPGLQIPLKGTPSEKKEDAPKKEEEQKQTPVQPAPASPSAAPPAHAEVDDALASGGRPLESGARRSMEARFGYDFSGVRIHDDARAAATARSIDAAAFTVGEDIAFAPGRYDPSSPDGKRLLAHELAHTVQQRGAVKRAGMLPTGSTLERRASEAAHTVASGAAVALPLGAGDGRVARALADLPEAERKRIQVVTANVTVPGIAEKFATTGTKVTFPFPSGVTPTFDPTVDAALQHGLSNVAAVLSNGTDITPAPLVENSTLTLELDVPGKGKGLYRFTYDAPPSGGTGTAPAPRILVEALGTATAPAGTKPPAAPTTGGPAPKDPVAEKITKYSLSHSYTGAELDSLRAALDQIPDAQLSIVSGLKFARGAAKQTDPTAAGDYDPKTHTVTMYNKAFAASESKFKATGAVASDAATRAIVHEIGHAIDLTALRKAGADKDKADKAVDALSTKYPDPDDPKGFSYPKGGPEEKDVKATLKAQKDAETALSAARSLSGTQSVKQPTGEFKDVIGTQAQGNKFREAVVKDGGKAVTAYGAQDFQESYAEAYSLYITSPDTLKTLRPNVYDYFDKNLPK